MIDLNSRLLSGELLALALTALQMGVGPKTKREEEEKKTKGL